MNPSGKLLKHLHGQSIPANFGNADSARCTFATVPAGAIVLNLVSETRVPARPDQSDSERSFPDRRRRHTGPRRQLFAVRRAQRSTPGHRADFDSRYFRVSCESPRPASVAAFASACVNAPMPPLTKAAGAIALPSIAACNRTAPQVPADQGPANAPKIPRAATIARNAFSLKPFGSQIRNRHRRHNATADIHLSFPARELPSQVCQGSTIRSSTARRYSAASCQQRPERATDARKRRNEFRILRRIARRDRRQFFARAPGVFINA